MATRPFSLIRPDRRRANAAGQDFIKALKAYLDARRIRESLTAIDGSNSRWQRDLSVSCNKVGDALAAQDRLDEALKSYQDSLAIRERLAVNDGSNLQSQRDLSVSYDKRWVMC